MINLISAKTEAEMISAGRPLVENLFGQEAVTNFANSVCDSWALIQEIPEIDTSDEGTKHANKLRKLIAFSIDNKSGALSAHWHFSGAVKIVL